MTETITRDATPIAAKSDTSKPRLLDQVRAVMRTHHYAYRTEQTYLCLNSSTGADFGLMVGNTWSKLHVR